MSNTVYVDTYLTGPPDQVQAVLDHAVEDGHAIIPMKVLDGIGQACVRLTEGGAALRLPEGADYALEDLMRYPQTSQVVVGVFMPDPVAPEPAPEPENE